MAVNDRNKQTPSQPSQAAPSQGAPNSPHEPNLGTQPTGGRSTRGGFSGLNDRMRRAGTVEQVESRSSTILKLMKEVQRNLAENGRLDYEFDLTMIDRETQQVGLPSVLLSRNVSVNGKQYTVVRTMVIETSALSLRNRTVFLPTGQKSELETLPVDVACSSVYWRAIESLFTNRGQSNVVVQDAGQLIIPEKFDLQDETAVNRLFMDSANRVIDVEEKLRGEPPFNVAELKDPNQIMEATLTFSEEPHYNLVDIPVRNDILIKMRRREQSHQQLEPDDFYEQNNELNSLSCFVNLEYNPQSMQTQPQQFYGAAQMPKLFVPAVVITEVNQAEWLQAQTPEMFLLALSNAYRVTNNMAWAETLRPQSGKVGPDLRDVGSLGYLTPARDHYDLKSDTVSDQAWLEWLHQLVEPHPEFMIDIDPAGPHSLIGSFFLDAAFGGEFGPTAKDMLFNAANNLTNNKFQNHFDRNKHEFVIPTNTEVNIGYYTTPDGERRDVRDLDVLAMLNLTNGDNQAFLDWYETYAGDITPEAKLERRVRLERHYLGKNAHYVSRAQRLVLTAEFIQALDAATAEAGCAVQIENVTTFMGRSFTGNTNAGRYAVSGTAQSYQMGGNAMNGTPSHGGRYPGTGGHRYVY